MFATEAIDYRMVDLIIARTENIDADRMPQADAAIARRCLSGCCCENQSWPTISAQLCRISRTRTASRLHETRTIVLTLPLAYCPSSCRVRPSCYQQPLNISPVRLVLTPAIVGQHWPGAVLNLSPTISAGFPVICKR